MKKNLVKLVIFLFILGSAASASALTITFDSQNIEGTGTITYYLGSDINKAPEFEFIKESGTITQNLLDFVEGDYFIDIMIENLQIDANEDGNYYQLIDDLTFSSPKAFHIPSISIPSGSLGPLSWEIDFSENSLWMSYDFNSSYNPLLINNKYANLFLATTDIEYSGNANGVMDANIKWDRLKIQLRSPEPVPEPSTILLVGSGLLGLVGFSLKRQRKS